MKIERLFARLLCALLFSFCAPNAFARASHAPAAAATVSIHPALYVVRDADSALYLFGTVHVRPRGAPWGGADAQAALAASDQVWTEIEISPAADAQAQNLLRQMGTAAPDHPLSSLLSEDENTRLTALAHRLNISMAALNNMQPWLAAIVLSMAPVSQAGFDAQSGVDRAVSAAARGKHMRAFETVEQQLRFIAALSAEAQHQMLLDAIDESEGGAAELRDLIGAWERGDQSAIERLVVDDMHTHYPELYDVLFRQRNAVWVNVLMHELDGSGTEFIAVGAGHLVGADGLVAQLRARGAHVERVGEQKAR